jgi:hypothetical protein
MAPRTQVRRSWTVRWRQSGGLIAIVSTMQLLDNFSQACQKKCEREHEDCEPNNYKIFLHIAVESANYCPDKYKAEDNPNANCGRSNSAGYWIGKRFERRGLSSHEKHPIFQVAQRK